MRMCLKWRQKSTMIILIGSQCNSIDATFKNQYLKNNWIDKLEWQEKVELNVELCNFKSHFQWQTIIQGQSQSQSQKSKIWMILNELMKTEILCEESGFQLMVHFCLINWTEDKNSCQWDWKMFEQNTLTNDAFRWIFQTT
jgi:hypothetical protein